MAENSGGLVARFNGYSRQPVSRQIALLVGLAASIALGIGLVQWMLVPNYKPLFGSMAAEDTTAAMSTLDANGIDYRLDDRTGMVTVAADEVHRARLLLATEGFPRSGDIGFDSIYQEQEIGVSSFMEQARYHRSLEQELARTISALDGVRGARVHLAMAKQSAFLRQRQEPAASVVLHLYGGRVLSERQLAGIVHLVSASVPNLKPETVSVVDQQGRLLSSQGNPDDFGYSKEQFQMAQQLEQRYSQRIVDILEPILGPGRVHAQVSADIDFTRIERTSEVYAPDTVLRSEQTSEEMTTRLLEGGVPGTLANQPPEDPDVLAQPPEAAAVPNTAPTRSTRRETRNYEMDKTISHIRETPGTLRKLSIALVLDHVETTAEDGSVARAPLAPERVEEITRLAREAVGFSEERGDTVSVINASFVEPPALEAPPEPSILEQDWLWRLLKGLGVAAGLGALLLFVVRPLMQFSVAPVPAAIGPGQRALGNDGYGEAGYAQGGAAGELMSDDQVTLAGNRRGLPGNTGYQQQLQMARSVAEGEPQRAAHVMKQWVAGDG
ncbi:MAG: flagellar M-ring protein FliF [Haliea sp.]|uniref:flagellar basal-body MS-ring/collar protein FliF n=1 Tax=Haliea sp. TaxID=1932666 RepID=UPI000C472F8B|nr:flagellar basal-body MS-ring/collar protein FliF [Haliea sp.]MBM70504.1 flagellar M-ring protein FliF [Haliea sp.]|tara:strand:+ start:45128 stop:46792 length:1665 start_codon:yes stop_codon:yes gene_type:complete